jgi:biopolymer transport protein ExbD
VRRRGRRGRSRAIGHVESLRAHGGTGEINVTPLIDVVMVLIIFFLMVGHLVLERRGGVDLPEAASGAREATADHAIVVIIDGDGVVRIDGAIVTTGRAGSVVSELRAAEPGRPVQLRGSRVLPFRSVRPVLRSLREAGVTTIDMVAREEAS